ncbi:alkaline phosphatase [Chitinophaga jiangningensis]|uniref:Alkaline phosphatase n=1 Tax=Chitinophaga jiangningensis TaxID=1419482 RepID=A0A1M7BQ24_9BACT|nr:alkaline phosphatase [Chitinophaga jiangningensis]SHL57003.1 alkaline phosphatase [Chitinophaga jiangningensis]
MKKFCFLPACIIATNLYAQTKLHTMSQAHSHNDYERTMPFYAAASLGFGYIEADVHLQNGRLYVAHDKKDISEARTLEALYLQPIARQFELNGGKPYADGAPMRLLIDLKSAGAPTLAVLQQEIQPYKKYFDSRINPNAVQIILSGNVPAADTWQQYDPLFYFDGRPDSTYNAAALERVALISTDMGKFTRWNGKGTLVPAEQKAIEKQIAAVHAMGKPFRFWGAASSKSTYYKLMDLGVDVIGSDHPVELYEVMQHTSKSYSANTPVHSVYTPTYVSDATKLKSKNVILMIGDGTGLAQLYAGYTANRGDLNIFRMKQLGLSKTQSTDNYHTDSAAGGTALATGSKTNNREIGMDNTYVAISSLPEKLAKAGIQSGVLVTEEITGATPASFYGHTSDRDSTRLLLHQLIGSKLQLAAGGGKEALETIQGSSLQQELSKAGVTVIDQLDQWDPLTKGRTLVILSDKVVNSMQEGRGDYLKVALKKTLQQLGQNKKGFFLMVEGSRIDHGGHYNNLEYLVREMLDFDEAVGEALQFADQQKETTVIVTADHETGGLSLMDGDIKQGWLRGNFATNDHTGIPVMVFAYGPNSGLFGGVYENTEVFGKILKCFRL